MCYNFVYFILSFETNRSFFPKNIKQSKFHGGNIFKYIIRDIDSGLNDSRRMVRRLKVDLL